MATNIQHDPRRHIERFYEPHQLTTASPLRRLSAYLIEVALPTAFILIGSVGFVVSAAAGMDILALIALAILLLGSLGYLVWTISCWGNGQTPGKQVLSMYSINSDGSRSGGRRMFLREVVIKTLLFYTLLSMITFGVAPLVAALWLTWDRKHQALWDKVGRTYIAYSPTGYVPFTSKEMPPPARRETPPMQTGGPRPAHL